MRLKYQLRGLGIGIILAALLMGLSAGAKEESLTDGQIKERARTLGMVEEKLLSEQPEVLSQEMDIEEQSETLTEEKQEDLKKAEEEKQKLLDKAEKEKQETKQKMAEEKEAVVPVPEESDAEKTVPITISSGDGSGTVSRKLEEAGLIQDAAAYDSYLCTNGYDKKIRTGTYQIAYGTTEEEIAQKISSN